MPGISFAYLCYYNKMLETGFFITKKEVYVLEFWRLESPTRKLDFGI